MICEACGLEAPTRSVSFHQNIGFVVMRASERIEGQLCKDCVSRFFWNYSTTTLLLGWWEILSAPEQHEAVLKALETNGIPHEDASIAMVPRNLIRLEGKNASAMLRLSEVLEEHDDVQSIFSNFDIDEKELEAME